MADEAANGASGNSEPKNEETPGDWEMLSASSIGDLKSALQHSSLEESGTDEGVPIAAMHSQYFGQAAPAATASSGENISQDPPPKATDTALPESNTVAGGSQDVIESELEVDPATAQPRGPEFEPKTVKAAVTEEPIVASSAVQPSQVQPSKDPASRPSLLKRLKNVKKHLKSGNSVYAAALVGVVVGLVIFGRRWHLERLKNIELELQNSLKEEKINQLLSAKDIASIAPPNLEVAPATPASTPRSFFGSLRDLF